jgi:hypothetical protein
MTLDVAYTYLNFEINKVFGTYYTPPELDLIVDRAQMSLFNDYYLEFGTSQRLNDAMSPFKKTFQFTGITNPNGLIDIPDDYEYLLSLYTIVQNSITGLPQNRPVPILNEDEKVARDNSQIYPPSIVDPYALVSTNWDIQLFPAVPQAGIVYYLSRPPAPVFNYSVVSGRVIVYNPVGSVQLAWADKDQNSILIKALSTVGINIREQDVIQYAETKSQENLGQSPDKI